MFEQYENQDRTSGQDIFEGQYVESGIKGAHDNINKLILESMLSNIGNAENFKFGEKITSDLPDIFKGNQYLEGMLNFFGNQGNIETNFLDSIFKSQRSDYDFEDLFNVNIRGQLGKDKGVDYNLRAGKGNVGLNLSKLF